MDEAQDLCAAAAGALSGAGATVAVAHPGAGDRASDHAPGAGMRGVELNASDADACLPGVEDADGP